MPDLGQNLGVPNWYPSIRALDNLVNNDRTVYNLISEMLNQPSMMPKPNTSRTIYKDIRTTSKVVKPAMTYPQLRDKLQELINKAPEFSQEAPVFHGGNGVPFGQLLYPYMCTVAGHSAFLNKYINKALRGILKEWGLFLKSPQSANVLKQWLADDAKTEIMDLANGALGGNRNDYTFEEFFQCDKSMKNLGYKSWDAFFSREVRDIDTTRPIASPEDDNVIANACESEAVVMKEANTVAPFWIKEQPYSLCDMLGAKGPNDPIMADFPEKCKVWQGFLSSFSYHRWHAPVSGTIKSARIVKGTTFSIPIFPKENGRGGEYEVHENLSDSQLFLANQSSRAVIVIEADNRAIGTMAFIAVGMLDVSTCEISVVKGDRVKKGDEMGMFHFGGSSHCLVFGPHVNLEWKYWPEPNYWQSEETASVASSDLMSPGSTPTSSSCSDTEEEEEAPGKPVIAVRSRLARVLPRY